MPRTIERISPTGTINRRAVVTDLENDQVLVRENCYIVGEKPYLRVKKFPGSDRYNSTSVGSSPVVWAHRYYTKANLRKNFFFSGGSIYHIDDNGNTTQGLSVFSPIAYPTSVEMRVSDTDILYFSEGINTGMYSYDGNSGNTFLKETAVTLNFVGMVGHLDRIFGFEEDSEDLYFSVNLTPTNFTDSTDAGFITIGAKRGSKIQQIIVYQETLFIFKTDSIWVLNGRTPSEFSVQEVNPSLGLAARRSLQASSNVLVGLMSDYEIHSFGGTQESMVLLTYGVSLSGGLLNNDTLLPILNLDKMENICSVFHNNMYRMSFTENGDTTNKLEYIFNFINKTDAFTRGNNVSCYLKYDRVPDKNELVTGRSDLGRLMHQYRGLNWDNQGTSPTMRLRLQTAFFGSGTPRNIRIRRYWMNLGVLGAQPLPIGILLDGRTAVTDSTSDEMVTRGEFKLVAGLNIQSQDAITSRQTPRHNNSKCLNFSLFIDHTANNFDTEFSSIDVEIITKNLKRSQKVGV